MCSSHEIDLIKKASVIDTGMNHLTFLNPSSLSFVSTVDHLSLAVIRLYVQVADALGYLSGSAGRLANLKLSHNYFTSACSAHDQGRRAGQEAQQTRRVHAPRS
jgi:hypothetical protein